MNTNLQEFLKSQQQQDSWFNKSPSAILIADQKGDFLELNPEALRLFAAERNEILSMNVFDFERIDSKGDAKVNIKDIKKLRLENFESKVIKNNGQEIDVEINCSWVENPQVFYVIIRDVTEMKMAELALKSLATSYAALSGKEFFEAVSQHMVDRFRFDFVFVGELIPKENSVRALGGWTSQGPMGPLVYGLMNTPCENVMGEKLCVYPDNVQSLFPRDDLLIQMGIHGYIGSPLFDKEDKALGILVALKSQRIDDVDVISNHFQIFIDRITAEILRARAEDQLHEAKRLAENNEEFSNMLANLSQELIQPDLSLSTIAGLTYEYSLKATQSDFGFVSTIDAETGDNVGHNLSEMMGDLCKVSDQRIAFPKKENGYDGLWGYALNKQKAFFTNSPTKHKAYQGVPEGHVPLYNFLAVPVIVKNQLLGEISLANKPLDYTESDLKNISEFARIFGLAVFRKRIEDELKSAVEQAKESERLKTLFLANMSHEIRTPMNSLLGFIDLLHEPDLEISQKNKFLGILQTSSERLLSTINDIIDISRIESNQMKITESTFHLKETMNDIFNLFQQEASEKGLNFVLDSPKNKVSDLIISDKKKIESILTNLIKNALKYTTKGEIRFGWNQDAVELNFFVKDTGIGIPKDQITAVFDRFVQAERFDNRTYEGSGLGLSISKSFVEMLGGEISVSSVEGKETRFDFMVPLK